MLNLDARPPKNGLLTLSNPKTAKGEKLGYLTAILHLAPARLSGREMCSHKTIGCETGCLNTAGHGGIALDADGLNGIQVARIRRTRYFSSARESFLADLVDEISRHIARARAHGLKPAVRLNGTSDLPWENIRTGEHPNIFAAFPDVVFYDYTKYPIRLRRRAREIPNYSLTFSLAESNLKHARDALRSGVNVAAVFATRRGDALPTEFLGVPVIDGDVSDLRFQDPSGVIVGLRAKGRAIGDTSGFVQSTN